MKSLFALIFVFIGLSSTASAAPVVKSPLDSAIGWEVFFSVYNGPEVAFPLLNKPINKLLVLNYSASHSVYFCWARTNDVLVWGRGKVKAALVDAMEKGVTAVGLTGELEETHCVRHDQMDQVPNLKETYDQLTR